jgi:hypothetical protein
VNRITRKLLVLPFILSAVVIDFNGCWRPVTAALDSIGVEVHTYDNNHDWEFWEEEFWD